MDTVKELKVAKDTSPKKLAGTIKYYLLKGTECHLMALGQQPICTSVKAIALLSKMFSLDYVCNISYFNQQQETGSLSGIQFIIRNNIDRE